MGNVVLSVFKFFFIAINFILILGGIASLAGGIYLAVAPEHALSFTEIGAVGLGQTGLVRTGGYLLIGAGCGAILIAIVGFAAARKDNGCLYITYAVIMMVILGVELAALIVGIIYKEQWESKLKTSVKEQINMNFDGRLDSSDKFTAAIQSFQKEFECCGIYNSSDFNSAMKWERTTSSGQMMVIPPSCCYYAQNNSCAVMPTERNSYASKGCWMTIEELMNRYTLIMIIIAAVTFGVELFLITFSICLVGRIKSGYNLEKK